MEGIQALKRLHLSDDNQGDPANKIINSAYFESQFRDFYYISRQSNLRCFPSCGSVHMEKSFCGNSILVILNLGVNCDETILFGEFCSMNEAQSFQLGDIFNPSAMSHKVFMMAKSKFSTQKTSEYVIYPSNKWKFPKEKKIKDQQFSFIIYLVVKGKVIDYAASPKFTIFPAPRNSSQFVTKSKSNSIGSTSDDVKRSENGTPDSQWSDAYLPTFSPLLATSSPSSTPNPITLARSKLCLPYDLDLETLFKPLPFSLYYCRNMQTRNKQADM